MALYHGHCDLTYAIWQACVRSSLPRFFQLERTARASSRYLRRYKIQITFLPQVHPSGALGVPAKQAW